MFCFKCGKFIHTGMYPPGPVFPFIIHFFYLSHRLMCSMMSFIHRYIIPHSYVHLLPFSFCLHPSPMQVVLILHTYLILLHMRNNTLFSCFLMFSYLPLLYSVSYQKSANPKSVENPVYPSENGNYILKKYRMLASVPAGKEKTNYVQKLYTLMQ